jgi:hypothetical protein
MYSSPLDNYKISHKKLPWLTLDAVVEACSNSVLSPAFKKIKTAENEQFTMDLNPLEFLISCLTTEEKVPTVNEFIESYIDIFRSRLKHKWSNKYATSSRAKISFNTWLNGVQARMYRTIITLLTELHAQLLCEEQIREAETYKTLFLDRNGLDWITELNGKKFGIRCHTDSVRAKGFLMAKLNQKSSRINFGEYYQIDLPYSLSEKSSNFGARLPNGFILCDKSHIDRLKRIFNGETKPIRIFSTDADLV